MYKRLITPRGISLVPELKPLVVSILHKNCELMLRFATAGLHQTLVLQIRHINTEKCILYILIKYILIHLIKSGCQK